MLKDCSPLGLPELDGLSGETLEKGKAYNERVATWGYEREELRRLSEECDDNPETVTADELRKGRDDRDGRELDLRQRAVVMLREYVTACRDRKAELDKWSAKVVADFEKTEKTVAKRLNAAGVSVETQAGWPHSPDAAETQFSHRVKESTDWRKANVAVGDAAAAVQAIADMIVVGDKRLADAEAELMGTVRRIAGLPAIHGPRLARFVEEAA